jgi:hypothetical protein
MRVGGLQRRFFFMETINISCPDFLAVQPVAPVYIGLYRLSYPSSLTNCDKANFFIPNTIL